jgi:hypothetical protein
MARKQTKSPRARWTQRIGAAWRASIKKVFETGRLLIEAKADLKKRGEHGEFEKMVEHSLPFGLRTAERLMVIAGDKRLTKATHGSLLPQSWRTLYELTRLSDDEFTKAISDGIIGPDMTRPELEQWKQARAYQSARAVVAQEAVSEQEARQQMVMPITDIPASKSDRHPGTTLVPQWSNGRVEHAHAADLYEAGRRSRARNAVQGLLQFEANVLECGVEAVVEHLLTPENVDKIESVRRGMAEAVRLKGALDVAGTRGNPVLKLIHDET